MIGEKRGFLFKLNLGEKYYLRIFKYYIVYGEERFFVEIDIVREFFYDIRKELLRCIIRETFFCRFVLSEKGERLFFYL